MSAPSPVHIGSAKQLFLDDVLIEHSAGFARVMNPPVKAGPALVPDKPWESHRIGAYGTVFEDNGVFRMWYDTIPLGTDGSHDAVFLNHATSTDGIHWEKTPLGLMDYQGSSDNNIIPIMACGTVFLDPTAPPDMKYKYVTVHWKSGMFTYWSADGLNWTMRPEVSLPLDPDTQNQAFYDARIGKYVAYLRGWNPLRVVVRCEMDDILQPWPYQPLASPYHIWGPQQLATPSLELPTVLACDEHDPPDTDFYNPAVTQYPWAPDAYFSFPSAYRHYPEPPVGRLANDGPVDIQMAHSRDGLAWTRLDRRPYVPLGFEGSPDAGNLYMMVGMIRSGDEIYQYYSGYTYTHGAGDLNHDEYSGQIIRTVQRLDGFVSLDADYEGASLTTKPLSFTGRRLELNINLGAMGTAKVALLDETGAALPGFSADDCDLIEGNSVAKMVTWRGSEDVSALAGRAVKVKLEMRAGKVYGVRFGG